jgi:hypothetical protein
MRAPELRPIYLRLIKQSSLVVSLDLPSVFLIALGGLLRSLVNASVRTETFTLAGLLLQGTCSKEMS